MSALNSHLILLIRLALAILKNLILLQRIKEDITQHEEEIARIVTIVGKLTDDENVSETEKNNIKAEMNRLQEKWNNTQNNVNLNYLRFGFIAFPFHPVLLVPDHSCTTHRHCLMDKLFQAD